jgi:hypothetical protein
VAPEAAPMPARRRVAVEGFDGPCSPQRRQRCKCGRCAACLGNARWDRIYDEKFADPAYYEGIVVRHNSALAEAL